MPRKTKREDNLASSKKIATIHQVAELAGVSTATVSRVFTSTNLVSEELAGRVHSAAQTLNYQPNRNARNLRTHKTSIAALVISDIENPFFTSAVKGIERVLGQSGYTLLLANSDEDEEVEQRHLQNLRAEGVSGVILAPTRDDSKTYQHLMNSGLVMVAMDRVPRDLRIDRVTVNNQDGTRSAVQHLVEQGHRKIAFITGLTKLSTSCERQLGYEQAMKECGLEINPQWIQSGEFRRETGAKAMSEILNLPVKPTAVITANNLMTLGALQAIYERKLRIPEDIAIVGFDDMSWAPSLNPPLTVIAQPTYELGAVAAQLLLDRLTAPDRPYRHVILDTHLIIRLSSGPHSTSR